MDKRQLQELARLYLDGKATPEQIRLLHEWYDKADEGESEVELVFTGHDEGEQDVRDRILSRITNLSTPAPPIPRPTSIALRWSIAAAALLLITGVGILLRQPGPEQHQIARVPAAPAKHGNDVAPGENKAKLVLGNGNVVVLSGIKNGAISEEGGVKVAKQDDKLIYVTPTGKTAGDEVVFNVISTPKGGQYQVVLADGTKVWLNAASSLRFPTSFKGPERRVDISGEAYFEVAKNAAMPFKVFVSPKTELSPDQPESPDQFQVEVLGTSFNVMSYENEKSVNTTLLEGAVRVKKAGEERLLQPGQQARYDRNTLHEIKVSEGDEEQAIAWKNGLFLFKEADLETILRQIARWYDVEISNKSEMPKRYFTGEVPRSVNLSKVLQVLELSDVHFRIDGRVLTVLP
jgi:transmembrane sensor